MIAQYGLEKPFREPTDEELEPTPDELASLNLASEISDRIRFDSVLGSLKKILCDPNLTNLEINEDGSVYTAYIGTPKIRSPLMIEENHRKAVVEFMANWDMQTMDRQHSSLQCDMPFYGCRVQAFAPPIANWTLIIRAHAKEIRKIEEYLAKGEVSQNHARVLKEQIANWANIVVAGGTDSGKTTLLNSLLELKSRIHPTARCVYIQDRRELRTEGFANRMPIMAEIVQNYPGMDGPDSRFIYGFNAALKDAMRSNVDFIAWGEVREPQSALGLLMAMNTGSRGLMSTIHANSAFRTMKRLEDLLRLGGTPIVRDMIAEVINVVAFMKADMLTGRRWLDEIVLIRGVDEKDEYIIERITREDA